MEKMILIPEWRYNKMIESLDKALEELEELRALRAELLIVRRENAVDKN